MARTASLGEASHLATFHNHLGRVRDAVEERLIARLRQKHDEAARVGPGVAQVVAALNELTLRGGKRFRPALLAAAYAGVDPEGPIEVAYEAGVALELLQSYLLIQDDWIDGDATRRGGPSVHARLAQNMASPELGPAFAVLASDLGWGAAIEVLASLGTTPQRVAEAIRIFVRVHEDVVHGQILDVLGNASDVEQMHDLKTGSYTVRGPLELGAALAGASPELRASLGAFAAPLGVAFQLRDDLLGAFGDPEKTGKPRGGDVLAGKRSAVLLEADKRLDAAGRRALERASEGPDALEQAIDALRRCGAGEAVAARLEDLCQRARSLALELAIAEQPQWALAGAAEALRTTAEGLPRVSA